MFYFTVPRSLKTTHVPSDGEQDGTFLLDNDGLYIVEDSESYSEPVELSPSQEDPLAYTDPLALPSEITKITPSSPDSQDAPSPDAENTIAITADITEVAPKLLNLPQQDSYSSSHHSKISNGTTVNDTSVFLLRSQAPPIMNYHTQMEKSTMSRAVPVSGSCSVRGNSVLHNSLSTCRMPIIISSSRASSHPSTSSSLQSLPLTPTTSLSASSSTFTTMSMPAPSNGRNVPLITLDPMKTTEFGPSRIKLNPSPSQHNPVAHKCRHAHSQHRRPSTQKTCSFFIPKSLAVPSSSSISSPSTSQSYYSTSTPSAYASQRTRLTSALSASTSELTNSASTSRLKHFTPTPSTSTSHSAPSRTVLLPPSDVPVPPQYRKRPHSYVDPSSKKSNSKSKKHDKDCSQPLPSNQKQCVPEQQEKAKRPNDGENKSHPTRAKCFLIERQEALRKLWEKQNHLLDIQIEAAEIQLAVYSKKLIVAETLVKELSEKNI